ncbi:MAG: MBL fold metallo-hydrolase [Bryobacterales bacterium]|nr:MBL fold metallo-hydrolase [Bryobacterales bacterium]
MPRKATRPARKSAPASPAPAPAVRIRMYRPGLGDCWLLTFHNEGVERHVLIDCGVLVGTPNQKQQLTDIAQHIRKTTSDELAVLVATHEHWDHVAGFHFARDEFQHLKPEQVWVAWTEDPEQTIATEKKKQNAMMARAIGMAAEHLGASASSYDRECGAGIARITDFDGMLGAAKFSKQSDSAMQFVVDKRKPADPYLRPGQVLEQPDWLPGGVRVYVLAPPMDRGALRQDRTRVEEGFKTEKKGEDGAAFAWMSAVMGASSESMHEDLAIRLRPFDPALAWPQDDFQARSKWDVMKRYEEEPWRRIDQDWLHSAASLALQLDNSINNTSLVLAFELVASRQVLLFVGDSELESWKSWQSMEFQRDDGTRVTAEDLLSRTVFYKVGHHGSGNATLRAALAKMTSPALVAAVPTDTDFAKNKQGWQMPAEKLEPELHARARGRVIYADPGKACLRKGKPDGVSQSDWDAFVARVEEKDALYVDYCLG